MQLSEMAVIVTGGASGLGEATARRLAGEGARVAIFDMNAERGKPVAAAIGGLYCQADVTEEASVDEALAKTRAAHGQERVLVNCAGITMGQKTAARNRKTGAIEAHPLAAFSQIVAVNLIGTFHMIAKCAAGMLALDPVTPDGGRGVIVNTASIAANDGQIGQVAYAASKGGVVSLTLPVARDYSAGAVRHPHGGGSARGRPQSAGRKRSLSLTPGNPAGICKPRRPHHRQRHAERRNHSPRRRAAHGPALAWPRFSMAPR
jgi:NAD(P)-dependent dehydrogenase (short-subunit alcohol dehydrogenase family)